MTDEDEIKKSIFVKILKSQKSNPSKKGGASKPAYTRRISVATSSKSIYLGNSTHRGYWNTLYPVVTGFDWTLSCHAFSGSSSSVGVHQAYIEPSGAQCAQLHVSVKTSRNRVQSVPLASMCPLSKIYWFWGSFRNANAPRVRRFACTSVFGRVLFFNFFFKIFTKLDFLI